MVVAKHLFVFLLMSLVGPAFVGQPHAAGSTPIKGQPPTGRALPDSKGQPVPQPQPQTEALIPKKAGSDNAKPLVADDRKANASADTWHDPLLIPGILPFVASLIVAGLTWTIYLRTRALNSELADRTVRIEAQKLLLEVNKQFVSNPELLAVYDEEFEKLPALQQADAKLRKALQAMAYMNINVFEIVFAVHPEGTGESAWKNYFVDTIEKCTFVRQELRDNCKVYNPVLIKVFNDCPKSKLPDKQYPPTV